jgi:C4-dicarboxylate-specific signal transduction histidine kinase
MGELTASIAHEVNQPLAAITTNAEAARRWLGRPVPDLNEARAAIERAASNARRASEVIRRIRELTRKRELQHEIVDIEAVVNDSLVLLEREIQRHQIKVFRQLECRRSSVRGDQIQLQQVLINLIMNAIHAIASREDSPRDLHLVIRKEGGQAVVAVRDSGSGISPEHLAMLFKAFFTTKENGVGIGLSICRSIIEVHGGKIWADSKHGEGATLTFSLPVPLQDPTA